MAIDLTFAWLFEESSTHQVNFVHSKLGSGKLAFWIRDC